jgi:hypothetical protein
MRFVKQTHSVRRVLPMPGLAADVAVAEVDVVAVALLAALPEQPAPQCRAEPLPLHPAVRPAVLQVAVRPVAGLVDVPAAVRLRVRQERRPVERLAAAADPQDRLARRPRQKTACI